MTPNRWFALALFSGVALAGLVLINSISNYRVVSERLAAERARDGMLTAATAVDSALRDRSDLTTADLSAVLDAIRRASPAHLESLQLLDSQGAAIARSGVASAPNFAPELVHARFRARRPVYAIRDAEPTRVVVEAFPVRVPPSSVATFSPVSHSNAAPPRLTLEITAPLDPSGAPAARLRRSLWINASAALALLATLAIVTVRFPSYLEGRRLETQLAIARSVQQDLLPSRLSEISDDFDISAQCVPASHVGGDFYDVFPTPNHGVAFVLGDVCGKGVPAALLTGVVHGAVRSSSWTNSPAEHSEATRRINHLLFERAARERFATMFWAYFDPQAGLLRYINAGHCPPLLFKANGRDIVRLDDGGPVLGLLSSAAYPQAAVPFEPGDRLVIYSDGIIEAADFTGTPLGEDRLIDIVEHSRELDAQSIRNRILASVDFFTGTSTLDDDRTLLLISRTSGHPCTPAPYLSKSIADLSAVSIHA